MSDEIRNRLDAQFENYTVVRQLYDVPPREVYEVTVDGQRAVCKFDTGETGSAGMEGCVAEFVAEETSVPVPEVIDRGEDYFVAAWHPDAPEVNGEFNVSEVWAESAGRGVARLHEETAEHVDGYGQFRPGSGTADGRLTTTGHDEWHEAALEYVREYRPTLARHGHEDIADRVTEYLEANPDAFAGTGDPICCHGWATPEHVSVRDGDVACLVDFEHAIAAPGEFDYWRTVIPAFGPGSEELLQSFRRGYESARPLPDGLEERRPVYGLLNLVYYFESLYVQDQHGPDETEQRAEKLRDGIRSLLNDLA